MKLNATQITDILFQKPDRITVGVLDQLSFRERFENEHFVQHRYHRYDLDGISTVPTSLKERLKLTFHHFAACSTGLTDHDYEGMEPDPRSLKQAMLELKAIGFTHEQISALTDCTRDIAHKAMGTRTGLHQKLRGPFDFYYEPIAKQLGYENSYVKGVCYAMRLSDHGFLGAVIQEFEQHSIEEFHARVVKRARRHDTNLFPTPEMEDFMYGHILEQVKAKLQAELSIASPRRTSKAKRLTS